MEESQTVVAQVSPAMQHSSAGYGDCNSVNPDTNIYATGSSGDQVPSETPAYPSASGEGVAPSSDQVPGQDCTTGMPTNMASYDSVNGGSNQFSYSAPAGAGENEDSANEAAETAVHQQFDDGSVMSSEEGRLWGLVGANCLDFNAWTTLIQETEKENNIIKIRKVYDLFLSEFPLCYGYWKKYADHVGRLETTDKVADVYERAVLAVTYSVDIWLHYCQFAISTLGEPDNIRSLFERGLAYVGSDYLSYPLWDEYINYEYTLQDWSRVAMIYTRIFENPIQQLDRYFTSFKEYASSRPLSEIFTSEDSAILAANVKISEHGVEGEVRPDVVEQSTESVSAGFSEAEQLEKYITIREEMYKKAKEYDSKIINFETAIRRPYFHVKPLDDPELENWHNYLDFIERGDDFNKVVKLYERCLIACANYPDLWIRYVLSMEASGSKDLANNALARATQVFVKKQPEIHLFAARFKELNDDVDGARVEYHLLYSEYSSSFLEAIIRRANMEYRLENKDAAFSIFEEAIVSEQAKELSQILPMIYVQYSRFSLLVAGDATKAREILTSALERVQLSKPFLEAVIHLESLLPLPKRIVYLDSLVEKYITPSYDNSNTASFTDREDISCIFLEFLDLFGDPQTIKKADNRHAMLFLRQKGTILSRKRRAEDYSGLERTKMSRTSAGDSLSGQTVMAGYPNAQNQWPASYGQNPSTWPPVSQAQAQQWNPSYAAQAGYSNYGGYGTYAHPQTSTSAPQSTAYGTYSAPPAVQGYSQPNYAQPSAAYSQQQAPATQAYYSSYY